MSLQDWLRAHGLPHLEPVLRDSGVDVDVLAELTDADLVELGLNLGDRKRLRKALSAGAEAGAGTAGVPAATHPSPGLDAGERRQMTVMFCDLVGSTQLAERLDPEDLRAVVAAYHERVGQTVSAHGGHVAQLLGDGVMVYFGFPSAHEDDAPRAVRAGLAAVEAVAALKPLPGLDLQCRVGIATGPVVLGLSDGPQAIKEVSVTGRIPNLAARLQACADPGQVVVSPQTRSLLGAGFEVEALPARVLKGIDDPVTPWRVIGERALDSRFAAREAHGEIIGREAELALLRNRWALACEGDTQAVLLQGEAGIGKSRLIEALRAEATGQTLLWQCSPHDAGTMLWPVLRQLERTAGSPDGLPGGQPGGLAGAVTSLPGASPSADGASLKVQWLDALIAHLRARLQAGPLLVILEDAHWIDPTTQELLLRILEELDGLPLLLVATARPEYEPVWGQQARVTHLSLSRLGPRQTLEMVRQAVGGKTLPPALLQVIARRTDGIPLFVEELTRSVLESGALREDGTTLVLEGLASEDAIPATLQDSLMARLDRLSSARELAQIGSVIGRDFDHRLLAAVCRGMPSSRLEQGVDDLLRSGLVLRRSSGEAAVYSFKHALVRDAAYQTLLRPQRAAWHGRVARVLQEQDPQVHAQRPELLAYHQQEAGLLDEAAQLWARAAQLAWERSALAEVAQHADRALTLSAQASDPEGFEWKLRMLRAQVSTQVDGYGSTAGVQAARRAADLALARGDLDRYVASACTLGTLLVSSGRVSETVALFDVVPEAAMEGLSAASRMSRLWILGVADVLAARFEPARDRLQQARELLAEIPSGQADLLLGGAVAEVAILLWLDGAFQHTGDAARGAEASLRAHALGERSRHAPTQAWALQNAASRALRQGDAVAAQAITDHLIDLSRRHGIQPRVASALMLQGHLAAAEGKQELARNKMQEGYRRWVEGSPGLAPTSFAAGAAGALARLGDVEGVAHFVNAGLAAMQATEDRSGAADLARWEAWLCQQQGDTAQARAHLRSGLSLARTAGNRQAALTLCLAWADLEPSPTLHPDLRAALEEALAGFVPGSGSAALDRARSLLAA